MRMITPSDVFALNPTVLFRELAGEAVLLNLESGVYYGLDSVGTRVWALVASGQPVSTVCATLLEEYDVEAETLERDVLTLVTDLCAKGLLIPGTAA